MKITNPIYVDSHSNILKRFIDIAKDCEYTDEFIKHTRQLEADPNEIKVFKQRYGHLSMFDASKQFLNDVRQGKL